MSAGRARSIAPGEISIATTAPDLRGHNALVTNALFPMAMALAEELAAAGAGLVLVARDAEGLAALAEGLQRRYGTSVTVMAADLSQPETPADDLRCRLGHSHRWIC